MCCQFWATKWVYLKTIKPFFPCSNIHVYVQWSMSCIYPALTSFQWGKVSRGNCFTEVCTIWSPEQQGRLLGQHRQQRCFSWFPQLTDQQLHDLTCEVNQLKLAKVYATEHTSEERDSTTRESKYTKVGILHPFCWTYMSWCLGFWQRQFSLHVVHV